IGVPDISNPPVYPYLLAGVMKALPFNFTIPSGATKIKSFWGNASDFRRFQPEFLITIFNQALMFIMIGMTFFWARKLFDNVVAWASAVLLLGTEMLWRFSASGLPTMLLLLLFMVLVWCLTLFEQETREPKF